MKKTHEEERFRLGWPTILELRFWTSLIEGSYVMAYAYALNNLGWRSVLHGDYPLELKESMYPSAIICALLLVMGIIWPQWRYTKANSKVPYILVWLVDAIRAPIPTSWKVPAFLAFVGSAILFHFLGQSLGASMTQQPKRRDWS